MKLNGPRNALFKGLQPSTFTVLVVLAPLVGPAPLRRIDNIQRIEKLKGSAWRARCYSRSRWLGHLGIQFARRMGFQVTAIARGPEKESLARKLGAHHHIDNNAQDPVAALQALGGARLTLATAANSKSMSPLLGGLAPRGQLIVAGAGGNEPIGISGSTLCHFFLVCARLREQ
ncbi:MAG TPA: zinc-binding dehydrogenase [Chthoniobacterales bacterium]